MRYSSVLMLLAAAVPAIAQQPTANPPMAHEGPVSVMATTGPVPPVLATPAAGNALTTINLALNWQPSPNVSATRPAPTRYEVCLAEPQAPCVNGRNAFVIRDLADLATVGTIEYEAGVVNLANLVDGGQNSRPIRQPITRPTITLPVPRRFHGRRFTWSVAACGPAPSRLLVGTAVPEKCNYASPRDLGWRIAPPVLLAPNVSIQMGHTRLSPEFGIRGAVPWADYYLFCITRPGLACGTELINTADQVILRGSGLVAAPPQPLLQLQGRAMRWTAAACNVQLGCTYQADQPLDFPVVGPVPAAPRLVSPILPSREAVWVDAARRLVTLGWEASPGAAHYAVCASPPGVACGATGSHVSRGVTANSVSLSLPASLGSSANWTVAACNVIDQCQYQPQVESLRIRPAVAGDFSVLTYNIYLRPTTLFKNGQKERAELLPAQLDGFDAIIFNEAFDDGARAILLAGLGQYPHRTQILGSDRGAEQDGGVIIVSRWPIVREGQRPFPNCVGADCQAQKGVSFARVCKNGKPYNIFGTHLQANHDREHQLAQRAQLRSIRDFVRSQNISYYDGVMIGGDFNLRRDINGSRSVEFGWINSELGAVYPGSVTDLPQRCTYCYGFNEMAADEAEGSVTLDYLVTPQSHQLPFAAALRTLRPLSPTPWREFFFEGTTRELSDHFPLAGQFRFLFPDDQGC